MQPKKFNLSKIFLLIIAIYQILISIMFFYRPAEFLYLLNVGPKVFRAFIEVPINEDKFWITFASQYHLLLGLLLLFANFKSNYNLILFLVFISKILTSMSLFYLFNTHTHYFAYIAGGIHELFISILLLALFLIYSKKSTHS